MKRLESVRCPKLAGRLTRLDVRITIIQNLFMFIYACNK